MPAQLFSPEDQRLLPVLNTAVNKQMGIYMGGEAKGADLAKVDDVEFTRLAKTAKKNQPLRPLATVRTMLGYDDDASMVDIMAGIHDEYAALTASYNSNGIDPTAAINQTEDVIGQTEGLIAKFSAITSSFAQRVEASEPGANGFRRWVNVLWVPSEEGHDKTLTLTRNGRDVALDEYDEDHIGFLQNGIKPRLETVPGALIYPGFQEPWTVTSYDNYADLLGPKLGAAPRAIRPQEVFHGRVYSGINQSLLQADPDRMVVAIRDEAETAGMPGDGKMPNYNRRALMMSRVGILDDASKLQTQQEVIRRLGVHDMTFTSEAAKQAQFDLINPDGKYGDANIQAESERLHEVRQAQVQKALSTGKMMPAILGVTVVAHPKTHELSFPMSK